VNPTGVLFRCEGAHPDGRWPKFSGEIVGFRGSTVLSMPLERTKRIPMAIAL